MDDNVTVGIYLSILIIIIIISGYFFSLTGIRLENFLTINLFPLIDSVLTINFLIFIIFASISLSIIGLIIRKFKTKIAMILSSTGYTIGIIISCAIFGLFDFLIPLLFGIIGIVFATITQDKKEKEYKSMPILRSGMASSGKIISFIAIGAVLFTLTMTLTNQSSYEKNFTDGFLSLSIGEEGDLQSTIKEPLINAIVDSQKQTINSIKNLNSFSKLNEKNDSEVLTFLIEFQTFEATINSEAYKQIMEEQFDLQQDQGISEKIMTTIPLVNNLSKMAWLFYTLTIFIFILMIGNLLVKNISGIIYSIVIFYIKEKENETLENTNY